MRGVLSRGLTTNQKNALASGAFNIVTLLKMQFNANYYYTNHSNTITYDSNNYVPSAFFVDVSEIREESSITNSSITVTIASATTTILNDLFTNGHIGKTVSVYLALLDSTGSGIDDPIQVFEGQTNALKYAETATSSEIVLDVANAWARIKSFNGRRLTDKSQQLVFTGDPSFELRDQIGKKITWGTQE